MLRSKDRAYQLVVRSIGCETWPLRVANERALEVFENDSIYHILYMKCRDGQVYGDMLPD